MQKIPGIIAEKCIQLFGKIEAFDAKGVSEFFTENPVFAFSNDEPCLTKGEIFRYFTKFFNSFLAVYHDIRNMWEKDNVLLVEMDMVLWRKDGTSVRLTCNEIMRFSDDKFEELRILMDPTPIVNLSMNQYSSVFTVAAGNQATSSDVMKKYFLEDDSEGNAPKWSIAGPRWSLEPKSDSGPMIDRIYHFNINCKDLSKSLQFYEMLGFKKILDFGEGMESKEMAVAFGMPKANIKGVHLRLGDNPESTRIDLLEFQVPSPSGTTYPHLSHTGIARICLKTKDIWNMYNYLRSRGVEFLSEPQALPGTNVTIVCFKDPNGIFLELLQGDL